MLTPDKFSFFKVNRLMLSITLAARKKKSTEAAFFCGSYNIISLPTVEMKKSLKFFPLVMG